MIADVLVQEQCTLSILMGGRSQKHVFCLFEFLTRLLLNLPISPGLNNLLPLYKRVICSSAVPSVLTYSFKSLNPSAAFNWFPQAKCLYKYKFLS